MLNLSSSCLAASARVCYLGVNVTVEAPAVADDECGVAEAGPLEDILTQRFSQQDNVRMLCYPPRSVPAQWYYDAALVYVGVHRYG